MPATKVTPFDMILFSLFIRLTRNLAASGAVMTFLMASTYFLQRRPDLAWIWGCVFLGFVAWVVFAGLIVQKAMVDLVLEVGFMLYPLTVIGSIALGYYLGGILHDDLGGGNHHWPVYLAGLAIALFVLFRCTELRFLPSIKEYKGKQRM